MRTAADCDLWIHTNNTSCRSIPRGCAQTLAVVGSAGPVHLPNASYKPLGDSQGNLNATPHITHPLGNPVASSTSLREVCVFVICMRDVKKRNKNKGNIIIQHMHLYKSWSFHSHSYNFLYTHGRDIVCVLDKNFQMHNVFFIIFSYK